MQMIRRAVSRQAALTDVAELRDPQRGMVGFKLAFGGHPLYCFADGDALREALALPAALGAVVEWNMIRHQPWARALGLPLRAASELQNAHGEWAALHLDFGNDADAGVAVLLVARGIVDLLVITDVERAPAAVTSAQP